MQPSLLSNPVTLTLKLNTAISPLSSPLGTFRGKLYWCGKTAAFAGHIVFAFVFFNQPCFKSMINRESHLNNKLK